MKMRLGEPYSSHHKLKMKLARYICPCCDKCIFAPKWKCDWGSTLAHFRATMKMRMGRQMHCVRKWKCDWAAKCIFRPNENAIGAPSAFPGRKWKCAWRARCISGQNGNVSSAVYWVILSPNAFSRPIENAQGAVYLVIFAPNVLSRQNGNASGAVYLAIFAKIAKYSGCFVSAQPKV